MSVSRFYQSLLICDALSAATTVEALACDWKAMADATELTNMGGPAPVTSDARR